MKQILTMLPPEEVKKVLNEEIRETEERIIVEKDSIRKKVLNERLITSKKQLKEIERKID